LAIHDPEPKKQKPHVRLRALYMRTTPQVASLVHENGATVYAHLEKGQHLENPQRMGQEAYDTGCAAIARALRKAPTRNHTHQLHRCTGSHLDDDTQQSRTRLKYANRGQKAHRNTARQRTWCPNRNPVVSEPPRCRRQPNGPSRPPTNQTLTEWSDPTSRTRMV